MEIQRLIGRSLRSVVDLQALGERQITIDCDVIQADGGTRTASITGAWVALSDCLTWMKAREMLRAEVLRDHIAAVSCGVCKGTAVLDLDYAEDSEADTDANFVMTGSGNIVEIQATAEKTPFSEDQFQVAAGAGAQGHREAGGLAENGGDVSSPGQARDHRKLSGPLVIATHNPGKLKEMRDLLAPYGITAQSAGELGLPEPKETGRTFAENARIKAMAAAMATGRPAFADDSGLVVDALGGEPGIHSARWAGPDKDFRFAMNHIQTLLIERGAQDARATARAFHRRALSRLARRPCGRVRRPRRRRGGVAAARRPRLRLRSVIFARRIRSAPSAR